MNATRLLSKELARGINNFLMAKYDRKERKMVRNWDCKKRFSSLPWEEVDSE